MEESLKERIRITVSCTDSEYIPKVSDAGEVVRPENSVRPYQIMHNGLKVYVDSHYGDFNTEVITRLKGHHEPQEEKVFHEVLKVIPPNAVMLELGSFWAYYSMWFNKVIPGAKNYMVEPMEEILKYGVQNFELNGLTGDFIQACVGRVSREHSRFQHWDGTFHDIPQVSVDDLLKEKAIGYLDILHSDIQGAEYEMLEGARESFRAGKIGFVFISTHSDEVHRNCLRFLLENNYKLIAEHSLDESFAVDGLIAASHPDKGFGKIPISKKPQVRSVRHRISKLLSRLKG